MRSITEQNELKAEVMNNPEVTFVFRIHNDYMELRKTYEEFGEEQQYTCMEYKNFYISPELFGKMREYNNSNGWLSEVPAHFSGGITPRDDLSEGDGLDVYVEDIRRALIMPWKKLIKVIPTLNVGDYLYIPCDEEDINHENTEFCSECESEQTIIRDIDLYGYVAYCSKCGTKLMLCDRCMHSNDYNDKRCDFGDTKYCWREMESIRKLISNYLYNEKGMNDTEVYKALTENYKRIELCEIGNYKLICNLKQKLLYLVKCETKVFGEGKICEFSDVVWTDDYYFKDFYGRLRKVLASEYTCECYLSEIIDVLTNPDDDLCF